MARYYLNGGLEIKYIEEDMRMASDVHLLLQSKDGDYVILCGNDKNPKKRDKHFFLINTRENDIWKVTNFKGTKIADFLKWFGGDLLKLETEDVRLLVDDRS
jgi:hypothetical protein